MRSPGPRRSRGRRSLRRRHNRSLPTRTAPDRPEAAARDGGGFDAGVPAEADLPLPGWDMHFLVGDDGVRSLAAWTHGGDETAVAARRALEGRSPRSATAARMVSLHDRSRARTYHRSAHRPR